MRQPRPDNYQGCLFSIIGMAICLAIILLTSCSTRREVTKTSFQASSLNRNSNSIDSLLSHFDWVSCSNRTITLTYYSDPDTTGQQHITCTATIQESRQDTISATQTHVTTRQDSIQQQTTTTATTTKKTEVKRTSLIPTIIITALLTILATITATLYARRRLFISK